MRVPTITGRESRPCSLSHSCRCAQPDMRLGVSSSGLSWEMKVALQATARLPSPSFWFGTEQRTGALTVAEARQARESPAPGKYAVENVSRNGRVKTPGGSFTVGLRTPVTVSASKRFGGTQSTLGTYDVVDECGIHYSSMGKQTLGRMPTQPRCQFGNAPRRGLAQPSNVPGPADYAIYSSTGNKKDHSYKTKTPSAPSFEFTRCV